MFQQIVVDPIRSRRTGLSLHDSSPQISQSEGFVVDFGVVWGEVNFDPLLLLVVDVFVRKISIFYKSNYLTRTVEYIICRRANTSFGTAQALHGRFPCKWQKIVWFISAVARLHSPAGTCQNKPHRLRSQTKGTTISIFGDNLKG